MALDTATELLNLAHEILSFSNVKLVLLDQVIYRAGPNEYNDRVDKMNEILKNLCCVEPRIVYWTPNRLWHAQKPLLLRDGVHLSPYGNYLYYFSLRMAVVHARNIWQSA